MYIVSEFFLQLLHSCLVTSISAITQNALLPAGMRQKSQTSKAATGPLDRERLLSFLEKEAMEHQDREDVVPFTGEKKGVCGLASVSFPSPDLGSSVQHVYGGVPGW